MILKEIELENFKSFEKIALKFEKGFNLLVGNNGAGKTSVLTGISSGLTAIFEKVNHIQCEGIKVEDIRSRRTLSGDVIVNTEYFLPTKISCTISLNNIDFSVIRERKDHSTTAKTTSNPKLLTNKIKEMINTPKENLPVLSFQQSKRLWDIKEAENDLKIVQIEMERINGYVSCLKEKSPAKTLLPWIYAMNFSAFQKKMTIKEYEMFERIVNQFMHKINDDGNFSSDFKIHYGVTERDVNFQSENESFLLSQLSAGYQSILCIVMDIAYRSMTLNPNINLEENPITGIVIIDEIDMHLHPEWQWKIIDALTSTFPSVQFIAATHSPIVISSCKNANIILIDENHEIDYLPSGYGVSVNDVLDLRLGSIDKPKVVSKLVADFDEAMETFDKDTVQKKITKLEKELGNDHPQVVAARNEFTLGLLIEEI